MDCYNPSFNGQFMPYSQPLPCHITFSELKITKVTTGSGQEIHQSLESENFRLESRSFPFFRSYDPERFYQMAISNIDNKNPGNRVKNKNMMTIPHQHQH